MTLLASEREAYVARQRLLVAAIAAVRRAFRLKSPAQALPMLRILNRRAAFDGAFAVRQGLLEQRIRVPSQGVVSPDAVAASTDSLLRLIVDDVSLFQAERLAVTAIADSGRVAGGAEIAARPGLGWIRVVNAPCCDRCAILSGRLYRWSDGFERHPQCDCVHRAVDSKTEAAEIARSPYELFEAGQIKGMSEADAQAVRDGADIFKIVNVHREEAGLTVAGRVVDRGGRLTPEGVYRLASDQAEAIALLKRFGYLT